MTSPKNKVILMILDGYGVAPPGPGNAISQANSNIIPNLSNYYPHTTLQASGEAVGLPATLSSISSSSEVGHLNLGAGRIVPGSLARINMSIADGSFYQNKQFLDAINHVNNNKGCLHLIGLLSNGTVHSNIEHLYALLFFAKEHHIDRVFLHLITDGRDAPPKSAITYLDELNIKLNTLAIGTIASVIGRYYAMDRDLRWERIEKAYQCLTQGIGNKADNYRQAIEQSYQNNITDEFIIPTNIIKDNSPVGLIKDNDAVIFFNFRVDRPRQLTKAFVLDDFAAKANITDYDPYAEKYYGKINKNDPPILNPPFTRQVKINNLFFVTMTEYERNLPIYVAYPPEIINNPLGKVIADNNLKQLRLAESEKDRFVTFYFNGLNEAKFEGEDRLIIPSPKVATYDLKPEMSAPELTNHLIEKININQYDFILINYANPDMVGHTGNLYASIRAIQIIDELVGKIIKAIANTDYYLIITADHGNIEQKINPSTGDISTSHTSNLVPFYIVNTALKGNNKVLPTGILADVAPTILKILGIKQPPEMTGRVLF